MQGFKAAIAPLPQPEFYCHSSLSTLRGENNERKYSRYPNPGELRQPASALHHHDGVDFSPSSSFSPKPSNVAVVSNNLSYANALHTSAGSTEIGTAETGCVDSEQFMYQKGTTLASALGNGQSIENWAESGIADNSQQTDTSTDADADADADDRNQVFGVSSENMLCF